MVKKINRNFKDFDLDARKNFDGDYAISNHFFTSFEGIPEIINCSLLANNNYFTSFDHISSKIKWDLDLSNNKIKSLTNLPKEIGGFLNIRENPIQGSLMNVFNVEGLQNVYGDSYAWNIINKYLPRQEGFDIRSVQQELRDAGFKEEAEIENELKISIKEIFVEINGTQVKIQDLLNDSGLIVDKDIQKIIIKTRNNNISFENLNELVSILDIDNLLEDKELTNLLLQHKFKTINFFNPKQIEKISSLLAEQYIFNMADFTNFDEIKHASLVNKIKENKGAGGGVKITKLLLNKAPIMFSNEELILLSPFYTKEIAGIKHFSPSQPLFEELVASVIKDSSEFKTLKSRECDWSKGWLSQSVTEQNTPQKKKKKVA